MFSAADHEFMARALRLAERGLYTTTPNPRVGCVIVKDGKVVGEGWHQKAGEAHAEVEALRAAGVDILRLSPQSRDFAAVIGAFRAAVDATGEAARCPEPSLPGGYCDGYVRGEAGIGHAG